MFTPDQINEIHKRPGKQTTLPEYLQIIPAFHNHFIIDCLEKNKYYNKADP